MSNKPDNIRKLIGILEKVPAEDFTMREFAQKKEHECGTVACALGHAAISGEFEGLSFDFVERPNRVYPNEKTIEPTAFIDGARVEWETAGVRYFGYQVTQDVFYGMYKVGSGADAKRRVLEALQDFQNRHRR